MLTSDPPKSSTKIGHIYKKSSTYFKNQSFQDQWGYKRQTSPKYLFICNLIDNQTDLFGYKKIYIYRKKYKYMGSMGAAVANSMGSVVTVAGMGTAVNEKYADVSLL